MKKVLIIHPEGNSFNNPSTKALIDLLQSRGVDLSIRYQISAAPMVPYNGVTLRPWNKVWGGIKRIVFDRLAFEFFLYPIMLIELVLNRDQYELIIGIDRQGVIEAYWWSRFTQIPFVFWSFEIMFQTETSIKYKKLEIEASKLAELWFVQDQLRAKVLMEENDLDDSKCRLVPLASAGEGKFNDKRLRDELGIPESKNVAILMGSLSGWTMAENIIRSVLDWPSDWVLIVHDRYGRTDTVLQEIDPFLVGCLQSKIFQTRKAVDSVDDLGYVLNGVTVGLAFYKPNFTNIYTGNNLVFLGLASGKIATFWRYGIPVIMNSIGEYSEISEAKLASVVIDEDLERLPDILKNANFSFLGINAKKVFESTLDFNLYRDGIWSDLVSVAKDCL